MTNFNLTKTLVSGLALTIALCPQVFGATIVSSSETTGKKCGDNCTWTLDSDGNLTVSGTGAMYDYTPHDSSKWMPWFELRNSVTNVVVENGINVIGSYAFNGTSATNISIPPSVSTINYGFAEGSSVKNLVIPDTVTSLGGAFCHGCPDLETVYISENVTKMEGYAFYSLSPKSGIVVIPPNATFSGYMGGIESIKTYCTAAQMSTCGANSVEYEKKGDLFYVYDTDGNVTEVFGGFDNFNNNVIKAVSERDTYEINDDGSVSIMDKNGMLLAKYGENGNLLTRYSHNSDGSVGIYDANGKLTGLKNAREITPTQAAALVKKGNVNTVTLTFK